MLNWGAKVWKGVDYKMVNSFLYKGKRKDNKEWIVGNVIVIENSYWIATSCLQGNVKGLFEVCAYEVIPETIYRCK